eukprot:scaffold646_cov367-Prasinococcus_capsulatus_cf.AAC.8
MAPCGQKMRWSSSVYVHGLTNVDGGGDGGGGGEDRERDKGRSVGCLGSAPRSFPPIPVSESRSARLRPGLVANWRVLAGQDFEAHDVACRYFLRRVKRGAGGRARAAPFEAAMTRGECTFVT